MADKVEELRQTPASGEKEIDEAALPDSPAGADTTDPVLNESSASCSGQEDGTTSGGERRVLSAQHHYQHEGFIWKVMRVIFYIPLKILSLFGLNVWQTNLRVSGIAEIDKSPLRRPASTSPQKRKRDEQEVSSDEGEDVVSKLLEDDEDYDSQDDKDFKPEDESSCSDEYAEGDTEAEISTLSVEDVTEPRKSALRNLTEVDPDTKAKAKAKEDDGKKTVPGSERDGLPAKCIDDPISKPEITPATVGVMG